MTDREGCCGHASDCAVHNEPAMPVGACDCDFNPHWTPEMNERARENDCGYGHRWTKTYKWYVRHELKLCVAFLIVVLALLAVASRYSGG